MGDKKDPSVSEQDAEMDRRGFIAGAAALTVAGVNAASALGAGEGQATYRAALIGHTGRGNYGHAIDTVWLRVPGVALVAVADANKGGLNAAVKRLKAPKGYGDYRKMLDEVKPDLVGIGPRWLDQHRDMVVAAAERGVRGIYLEKPMCRTLAEADEMVAACEKHKVKLAIAHQTRYSPRLEAVRGLIKSGEIGQVLELRARGKEDGRGGGEDLWVLGTHVLNLVHTLGGDPTWCFATVRQGGRPIRKADVKEGREGIGPLAGDEVHAMYGLAGGAVGHFDSVRGAGGRPSRFGIRILGSKGVIEFYPGFLPPALLLRDSAWSPGRTRAKWLPITSAGVGKPEPLKDGGLLAGNVEAVKDLIRAIEEDGQPDSSIYEARTATEMIVACFESQRVGGPVTFPLKTRANPLTLLP